MAIDVTAQITIDRPIDKVSAYVVDPANDTAWIGGISEAELLTDPPIAVGAQVRRIAGFLGKRIDYTNEVTEFDPPNRLIMRSVAGPFPMVVHYLFDAENGGTRVRVRNQGGAGGLMRLLDPLMGRMVNRRVAADLKTLKRLLEADDG